MWFRYLHVHVSHIRAAKDQASMHICTVLPDNVWITIFLWVRIFVIHLREKWKKPALTTLVSSHAQKLKVIRPASYVTMVVGAIYCDKIVHTKKKLLLTTWQTCINAYSYASLKSNRALIYLIEGTVTVNFKMLKGTIFVGYQNRNFHLQNVCAKLPSSSNIHSSQNWHRCSERRQNNDTWTFFHHCCFYQAILILW